MSDVTISAPGMSGNMRSVLWAAFWIALGFMLYLGVPWATDPALVPTIGFAERIGDGMNYLTRELEIFGVPFKEITRALALVIDLPADFLRDLLSKGFEFDWGDEYVELKPLSWIGLLAAMTMASYWIGGRNLGRCGWNLPVGFRPVGANCRNVLDDHSGRSVVCWRWTPAGHSCA